MMSFERIRAELILKRVEAYAAQEKQSFIGIAAAIGMDPDLFDTVDDFNDAVRVRLADLRRAAGRL